MNDLQVFENPDFGQVRTVTKDGEPWFVAKDVCKAFGDTNHNRSVGRIDEEDKETYQITDSMGRIQQAIIVNESGLYALLFAMQPQKANRDGVSDAYPIETQKRIDSLHKFKRWITHEVIPSIRKTGSYSIQEPETPAQLRAKAMMINAKTRLFNAAMKAVDRFQMSPVALEALGIPMIEEFTGVKTGYRPRIETTYSATELGAEFGVSANKIGRIAKDNGLKTDEYGITVLDKSRSSDKLVPCFRYNAKGRERLAELLKGGERNG